MIIFLQIYFIADRHSAKNLPFWVHKTTELCAVSNACLNPLIFGNYLLKINNALCCRSSRDKRRKLNFVN
uniref:G-protein coupled receptors family 1 profile domain-containing protein n=1 Tax=Romanomermis culicivorax TaxID=13658 RepID=A0A915KS85_ROMCU